MCVRDTGLSVRETVRDTQAERRRSSIREASLVQFFDPTQTSADSGSATVLSSAINLCNTLMGTGLLAMPGVMERSGWIPGLVLLLLMSLANAFSVEVVFRLCRFAGRPTSLGEIGDKAAARASIVIDLAVALNCVGTACSYVIVSTGNFETTFGGPRFLWVIVTVAIATPIAFLKDMDSLRHTSFAAVAILLYIVVLIIVYAPLHPCDSDKAQPEFCPPGDTAVATDFVGALRSFGALALAYNCQYSIPPIYNEMDTPTPQRCAKVYWLGFGLVTSLYVIVAVCGYYTFGDVVPSNIVDAYPKNVPVSIARVGLSLVVIFSYPIMAFATRNAMDSALATFGRCCCPNVACLQDQAGSVGEIESKDTTLVSSLTRKSVALPEDRSRIQRELLRLRTYSFGSKFETQRRRVAITLGFIAFTTLIGLVLDDIGKVVDLIGSVCGSMIAFAFPCWAYFKLFADRRSSPFSILSSALLVLGLVLIPLGVALTVLF